ncbi:MAG: SxtJ family membrane protein [Thermodesulfobacteriota bacterium]
MTSTIAPERKNLRSFGLIVGVIFIIIGLWPLVVHGEPLRVWAVVPAILLIPPALIFPPILYWPYRVWMFIGHCLGWVNTRIILGIVFFVIFTPVGLVMRIFGHDPMVRRFDKSLNTYKINIEKKDFNHMERQF